MTENFNSRGRALIWLAALLLIVFLGLQLVRPELPTPPVTADLQAPPEVKAILKNSCYSCHSNETKLPWFDQVVPAYWLVTSDVKEARRHLNFSELGSQPAAKQKATLYEAINMIQLGAMPLPSYQRVHPNSVVTANQLAILRNYVNPPAPSAPAIDTTAANAQYTQWIQSGAISTTAHEAANGVAYIPDYKNWQAFSSTDRFDNKTMRVILGNDIAIKAIAENHINPWPDGTTFAKVTWFQQPDGKGSVQSGEFQQVEFMIKGAQRYASTDGWGFARFRGADLKPYGKDAAFTKECTGCHEPVRKNDFVYTMPLQGQQ